MKYKVEISDVNGDVLVIHINELITSGVVMLSLDLPKQQALVDLKEVGKRKANRNLAFFLGLKRISGLTSDVFLERYEIQLEKGRLFSWGRILPHVLKLLRLHLAKNRVLEPFKKQDQSLKKAKKTARKKR